MNDLIEDTNKDICREMVDMFIEESLASISELENCCQSGDWIGAASHAHNISSSCQTFGCEALSSIAVQLELESKKNNMGECIHLATLLPQVFLKSQQSLYNIFQRIEDQ